MEYNNFKATRDHKKTGSGTYHNNGRKEFRPIWRREPPLRMPASDDDTWESADEEWTTPTNDGTSSSGPTRASISHGQPQEPPTTDYREVAVPEPPQELRHSKPSTTTEKTDSDSETEGRPMRNRGPPQERVTDRDATETETNDNAWQLQGRPRRQKPNDKQTADNTMEPTPPRPQPSGKGSRQPKKALLRQGRAKGNGAKEADSGQKRQRRDPNLHKSKREQSKKNQLLTSQFLRTHVSNRAQPPPAAPERVAAAIPSAPATAGQTDDKKNSKHYRIQRRQHTDDPPLYAEALAHKEQERHVTNEPLAQRVSALQRQNAPMGHPFLTSPLQHFQNSEDQLQQPKFKPIPPPPPGPPPPLQQNIDIRGRSDTNHAKNSLAASPDIREISTECAETGNRPLSQVAEPPQNLNHNKTTVMDHKIYGD